MPELRTSVVRGLAREGNSSSSVKHPSIHQDDLDRLEATKLENKKFLRTDPMSKNIIERGKPTV